MKIGKFDVLKFIGGGGFGKVYLVKDPSTGYVYAVKSMMVDETMRDELFSEIQMFSQKYRNDFLLRYHAIYLDGNISNIFTDYCEKGDLCNFLEANNPLSIEQILSIFAQIVCAFTFLHENGVIHCDMKPENVLVNGRNEMKVCDFGLSKFNNGPSTMRGSGNKSPFGGGTHGFIPEEVLLGKSHSAASDVFAAGCTMYFVATGYRPFDGDTDYKRDVAVTRGEFLPIQRTDLSNEVKQLIYQMMNKDPSKRPSFASLMAHPLLKTAITALPPRGPVLPSPDVLAVKSVSSPLSKPPQKQFRPQGPRLPKLGPRGCPACHGNVCLPDGEVYHGYVNCYKCKKTLKHTDLKANLGFYGYICKGIRAAKCSRCRNYFCCDCSQLLLL